MAALSRRGWREEREDKSSRRSNGVPLWLLQDDIKSSMKRNLHEPVVQVLRHPLSFLPSSWPAVWEGANFRDCLPLKGIMTVFCLIFHSMPEVKKRGAKSNTYPLRRERKKEKEKKGRSKDRYASCVTGFRDAATEAAILMMSGEIPVSRCRRRIAPRCN